ncbi:glycosyltransferase family 39 protein [bacterium]|nr:MAG: glycosyltransferase family 39 protein [bacterium]
MSLSTDSHGDEAIVGLEGERILREGSIGVYSPRALGQPTGPLYLTALSVGLFGSTIWAVRAVSALIGTITVGVFYLMLRRHAGGTESEKRVVALLGAAFLATSQWHLHYSRIGFPLISWPLCALLMIWGALEAAKHKQARWWCVAGVLTGLGIYSYNAHIMCMLALGAWMLFFVARERETPIARRLGWLLAFISSVIVTAMPMLLYAFNPSNGYFKHSQAVSIFTAPNSGWAELHRFGSKFGYLSARYIDVWNNLGFNSRIDSVDGIGVVPPVPAMMMLLAALGLLWGWKSKRGNLIQISLFFAIIMPIGPTITIEGLNRRVFAIAPLLAFLAAVGIIAIYRWAQRRTWKGVFKREKTPVGQVPSVVVGCLVLLFIGITGQNLYNCFVISLPSDSVKWTYGQEMVAVCRYLNTLPPDAHVYFYSRRWSKNYETRVFLARDVHIEDRSTQFGDSGDFSLELDDAKQQVYFVLVNEYQLKLPELEKLYPRSQIVKGLPTPVGNPTFIAVHPY